MKIYGTHEPNVVQQLQNCLDVEEGARGVLCADGHLGYSQPIGGAVAYREHVSPSGVGYDIGCGNLAVMTNVRYDELGPGRVSAVMNEIVSRISFGMGRKNDEPVDHPVLDKIREANFAPQRQFLDLAERQLGTVGAGNHYVDLFRDEEDRVWVGVHFGSRGFGHKTASGFLALAKGLPFDGRAPEGEMMSPPVVFPATSDLGQSYVEAMTLAGEYAYAGREVVVSKVLEILGAKSLEEIHNHHNFCLTAETVIPTPDGPRRMDEIAPGDVIYSVDVDRGVFQTRVTDSWKSGTEPILTISTGDRELRCTASHPVLTIRTRLAPHPSRPWHNKTYGDVEWKSAGELQIGDVVVCAENYYERDRSRGVATARLAGVFLGDGWIRHSGWGAGLAIGTRDEGHTERYLGLCQDVLPQATWRNNVAGGYGLECASRTVNAAVRELGLGKRSPVRTVPTWAFRLPREEKLALLAGYIDADGSVGGKNNSGAGMFGSASRELALGIRELAIGCGLAVGRLEHGTRTTNFGRCEFYSCGLRTDAVAELPLWHDQKSGRKRWTKYRKNRGLSAPRRGYVELPEGLYARTIRSIAPSGAEDVFDLSIEAASHAFIANGIVVHNCWREEHDGETFWVVRKGCTPAFPGQKGFVGATMGEDAVILEGTERASEGLFSTVHGAGRAMSRTKAAGKVRRRKRWACMDRNCERVFEIDGVSSHNAAPQSGVCPDHPTARVKKIWITEVKSKGLIDFDEVKRDLETRGITLVGGAADEAPGAYKRLDEVLAEHEGTVRVLHRLRPIGVAMAGADVTDLYKD